MIKGFHQEKRAEKLFKEFLKINSHLSDDIKKQKELAENSFHEFVKLLWPYCGAGESFKDNWHVRAICDHLQGCWEGKIKFLVINMPPRFGKSLLCSVLFVAWVWTKDPSRRFITTSYGESLASRDTILCRLLIQSPIYQNLWGNKFKLIITQSLKLFNDKGGTRHAAGLNGAITGQGAWCIIVDDANNIKEVETKTTRERTNEIGDTVLPSRLDNRQTGCQIVVQQRSHAQDYSGHLLAKNLPYLVHLYLPMEFDPQDICSTIPLGDEEEVWSDPRTEEGELLDPQRFSLEDVEEIKAEIGSAYIWAGQFQQRPAPKKGGLIKPEDFSHWTREDPPDCNFIIQSWDTAWTQGEGSSYSAATTWGIFNDEYGIPQLILLSLFRDKLLYPELRHMVQRLSTCYHDVNIHDPLDWGGPSPDLILIEERASGYAILEDLKRAGVNVRAFNPKRKGKLDSSKKGRAEIGSHLIESGRIWVPLKPPLFESYPRYVKTFLDACELFPRHDTQDIVDTMSMTLLFLMDRKELWNPTDVIYEDSMHGGNGPSTTEHRLSEQSILMEVPAVSVFDK